MTLTLMRCPYCNGKSIEAQRTYTIQCGAPRTLYHCAPCARSFSETRHTPIAQLKTPIALVVQVLSALTGIHVKRDSLVSVRYSTELNSATSSVIPQRTDRHGILGEKPSAFQLFSRPRPGQYSPHRG